MNWYLYMARKRPSFIIGIARLIDVFSVIKAPYNKHSANQLTGLPNDEGSTLWRLEDGGSGYGGGSKKGCHK